MLLSILQVIEDPYRLCAQLLKAVPAGSYLAISIPASEPGVVPVNHWRPGPDGPEPVHGLPCYAAIGRTR